MKKVSIVSIGAAVQDVFLQGKIFTPKRENGELVEEFKLGTKNEIEDVVFSTGGGATNASVTFARLGMQSLYMGRLGHDISGKAVLEELAKENVSTKLVWYSKDLGTGYSTLLLSPNGERTILTYRGASSGYNLTPKHFQNIKPDWFYVSSLSGDIESLEVICTYAQKKNIKIAINPGKGELKAGARFKKLLPHFDILSINKEEMEQLFGTADLYTLMKKANRDVPVVVVTDGPRGSYVIGNQHIYKAGMYKDVPVIDRAGAGDAFCSGFVAMLANRETIEMAIAYGSANSTSVVGKIGAKAGILHSTKDLDTMKIETIPLA
jgi:sugar/nucleoside kinase (ribokinase family)